MNPPTISYARQSIDEDDVKAVVDVLRSDWLTTGPKVAQFEAAFATMVGTAEAVAVSSGAAALHAALWAAGVEPGQEVIVPAITFAATANAVLYLGATPVFADVDPHTLLIDPEDVQAKCSDRTRAIVAVDYGGQPANYDRLRDIALQAKAVLVADACHALGGTDEHQRPVGSLAELSTFSFHPVKPMTTAEGGMISTNNSQWARQMRAFRNHGIQQDHRQRAAEATWVYEMTDLGFNYRLSDLQCALGLSQLKKMTAWGERRRQIARFYDDAFANLRALRPLAVRPGIRHAYHLYAVQLELEQLGADRRTIFRDLRSRGLLVNVHYIPVYSHPYYRQRFGDRRGLCPRAEAAYEKLLSLPIYAGMTEQNVTSVTSLVREVIEAYQR